MLKKEEIEKIERYIKGESDNNEVNWVESLFVNKGEDNHHLKQLLKNEWDNILNENTQEEFELRKLLDRIHHLIRKDENLKRKKPLQKFIRIYMKAAAVLLLPSLIAGGIVYSLLDKPENYANDFQVNSTIYAPMGSRVSFILPDSTTGMLNSGSNLSYSLPFTNNRQIKLEGEAWFVVKNHEKQPFEISAGNSTVKVFGTSFNLSAYPAENYVEVVLNEGEVEFLDKKSGAKVMMLPSQRLVFQNGNINKLTVDPAKFNAWTEGKLVFRGDSMAEVTRRLERWYNVKIIIADKELEKYSFRATFQDDPIEEVLRCLALTSPISYKIIPRNLMPDGTYRKEEITIYKIRI
jgi:transmembrane sensor